MGCGCTGSGAPKSTTPKSTTYVAPNGRETSYRTEIEARAAVIRNKGGTVKPAS